MFYTLLFQIRINWWWCDVFWWESRWNDARCDADCRENEKELKCDKNETKHT